MPLNWLWGYLLPVGTLLLVWGGLPPRKARRVTPLAALAVALAVLGYWSVGFAFHLGGAHAVNPDDPALAGLDRLLAPSGGTWGVVGLSGFFLSGSEITPTVMALFLAYLPLIATAVLLLVLALSDSRPWVMILSGALAGSVVFPIAACWIWGSGWLAHLGESFALGAGVVDFGGSIIVLWVPAMMALGVLLLQPRRELEKPLSLPPAYFPLLANIGALLIGIGWTGWALSNPFHAAGAVWDWNRAAVNVLLCMTASTLSSQFCGWLLTGELEPLLAARGTAVGWAAALAGAPFLPPWSALIIGLLAGILFVFILYAVEAGLRLKDMAAIVALGATGGLWGGLSVGVFADGRWGQGWNGMSAPSSGSVTGIVGLVSRGGSRQFIAQVVGILVLGFWGLIFGSLLGLIARLTSLRRAASQRTSDADDDVVDAPVTTPEMSPAVEMPSPEPEEETTSNAIATVEPEPDIEKLTDAK